MENSLPTSSFHKSDKNFLLPLSGLRVILAFLILGLAIGFYVGKLTVKSNTRGAQVVSENSVKNPVLISPISYVALAEGTLVKKEKGKITLEKDGSRLSISVADSAPVIFQDGTTSTNMSQKPISDVEIGTYLKGSVSPSKEFVEGDANGGIAGTSFFATGKK